MRYTIIIFLLILGFFVQDCKNVSDHSTENKLTPGGNIKYAQRFTIEKREGYTLLTITNPWQGAQNVNQIYCLVKRGDKVPEGFDKAAIIWVPVRRIITMSTTYLTMISAIGEEGKVIGVSGPDLYYNEKIREAAHSGKIADVGYDDNLNKELVVKLQPELVMVYGVGSESSGYIGKMKDLGIKVMFNADYLENDPLGKAEWIKVFGELFLKGKKADELFSEIAAEYNAIKSLIIEKADHKPKVMLGLPWKDSWFISPGNSFMSRLISDAGGDYLWKNTFSDVSMPYGIENVWMKAMNADYWLNISSISHTSEILTIDYRLGDLPSFRKGNLFNNNNRIAKNGGNDYWESGAVNPQVILKDIAAILHPDLFPGYNYYYYKKIK
jgi:iron complex transport system substrate-binding protein